MFTISDQTQKRTSTSCFLHTLDYHTKTLFQVHSGAHSTHNLNDEDADKSHSRYEFVKQKFTEIFAGELSQTSFTKIVQESVRIFTRNMAKKNRNNNKTTMQTCFECSNARNFNSKKCFTSAVVGGSS